MASDESGHKDLQRLSVEELAALADWMVPPSRRTELEEFKKQIRRRDIAESDAAAIEAKQSKPGEMIDDPRGYWPARGWKLGTHISSAPEVKTGSRGGKYTEARTKDGRPYRRYF